MLLKRRERIRATIHALLIILGIVPVLLHAQNSVSIDYFGQTPPGDSAVIFAPGIISIPNRNEQGVVFSPDGKECFFGEWAKDYSYAKIYSLQYVDKKWTSPIEAPFSVGHFTSSPFLSADGQRLYFHYANYTGPEPYDIWMVKRTSQGWSDPNHLPAPINSDSRDGCYSETRDGIIYFASNRPGGFDTKGDLWCARKTYGDSLKAENLGALVNSSSWESGPCVAPDDSYLIFTSERPGKIGYSDLYVTFKKEEKNWTPPVNMEITGAGINLKNTATGAATLSPDGRYLFFSRAGDVYWIRTKIIDDIKTIVFHPKNAN
jgi:hypothetical protein